MCSRDRRKQLRVRSKPFHRWPARQILALVVMIAVVTSSLPAQSSALPAQSGAIRVLVTDEFRRPIGAARVAIVGSSLGAVTDSIGVALIDAVRPGAQVLLASRVGYLPDSVAVLVRDRETARVQLSLLRDRAGADSIVFLRVSTPIDTGLLRRHVSEVAIVRYRQVLVAASTLRAGDVIPLRLFDDFEVVLVVSTVQRYKATGMRVAGTVTTRSGQSSGTANFVFHEGRLTGNIRIGPALYVIRPQSAGVHTIVEVDPARLPRELPPVSRPPDALPPLLFAPPFRGDLPFGTPTAVDASTTDVCSALTDTDVGRVPQVRVLVGYSPLARDSQGSTALIEEAIALAIDEMQSVLNESGIRIDVTLAGAVEVPITENSNFGAQYWLQMLWSELTTEPAVLTFREQRETYHADAMVLVSQFAIGGVSSAPLWPRGAYQDKAYAVVGRLDMNERMTLAHELGHVLGGQDEVTPPRLTRPPELFASSYRCRNCATSAPLDHGWVTLMGWAGADPTLPAGYREARIPRFSNPDRTWEDRVTGRPIGQPAAADHRATLSFFAATVANYRRTPVWFVASSAWLPWNERFVADATHDQLRLADLDGDGLADAFRTDPATGTWEWSRNTTEAWAVRNGPDVSLAVAVEAVRFADFNGDGLQDVFWIAGGKWFVSSGGKSTASLLNALGGSPSPALEELAFGDFSGDGRADVFGSDASTGIWWISHDGSGAWTVYLPSASSRKIKTSDLRFADLNGDSRTDVFASYHTNTSVVWRYVAADGSTWTTLQTFAHADAPPLGDLALGPFDDRPGADILVTTGNRWLVSERGSGPLTEVAKSCHRLANLWIADVDGDGILDVFRTGFRP